MQQITAMLTSLAMAAGFLAHASSLQAQSQRASRAGTTVQVDPVNPQPTINPLEAEVASLRAEVRRLQGALGSLRLTVNANHGTYLKHRHGVASYGIVTAKSICPDTPAIDGTMLAFTTSGGPTKGKSGPPE